MAYVSNLLTQSSTTGAASYALTLPPHVTNDVIVVCVSADGGGTLAATGWTQIGTTQVSGLLLSAAVFYKKAAGSSETCTITMGTADAIHVHMIILKDVDTSTQLDASNATVAAAATQFTTASVTTTTTDCLILYYTARDDATTTPSSTHSRPGPTATMHFLDSSDNGGTTVTTLAGGAAGWYVQRATGATPQPEWDQSSSEIYASFVMAWRNVSGGIIPPYVDDSASLGRQLMTGTWWASASTRNNQNFKATPLSYANVGVDAAGLATTFDAGAAVVDAGLNPYSPAVNSTPASSTTNAIGFELLFPTTEIDMSTGWVVGAFQASTSKMALFNQGSIAQGGGYLVLGKTFNALATTAASGNGTTATITFAAQSVAMPVGGTVVIAGVTPAGYNATAVITASTTTTVSYLNATTGAQTVAGTATSNQFRTFQMMARDNQDGAGAGFATFSVQPSQSSNAIGYSLGNVLPTTKIDRLLILNRGQNATGAFYYCDFHLIQKVIAAGGTSAAPVDTQGLFDIGRFCRIPLLKKSGASGLVAYVPIQIGGGDAVNFQIDAGALQFPRNYSVAKKEINYHGTSGAIGISYAGKSGDVVKHTNSVVTSPSTYYWEINSAATSAATWSFTGLLIVRANVTLRNVMTFADMSFSSCPSLIFSGCSVTGAVISAVPATNNSLTTDASTTIGSSTINVSAVTSGNYWCSVASPAIFSSCAFTGGGGHAIRITTAGTYSFVGNTFTSFGADGSNGAAIYNDSGGLVTINVTGGGGIPTVRNGAGATTVVESLVTTTITVKDIVTNAAISGARVIVTASDNTGPMPFDETVTSVTRSGATATVSHTSHGLISGKQVLIKGANQQEYNGVFTVTVTNANEYTYAVSGTPATPATGTIKATGVVIYGTTDGSGVISDTRTHASSQPITGRVRSASGGTKYKTGAVSGTVSSSTGFAVTVQLIQDG